MRAPHNQGIRNRYQRASNVSMRSGNYGEGWLDANANGRPILRALREKSILYTIRSVSPHEKCVSA